MNETFPQGAYTLPPDGFLQVNCLDQSTGTSVPIDPVQYSITGGNPGPLEINSANGNLSVSNGHIINYETASSYSFTVMCTSTTNAVANTATATVTILIQPVNEFRPIVSTSDLTVTLPENTPIGTTLVSTQPGGLRQYESVTDGDDGPDGVITYTLVADQTDSDSLTLDRVTGSLVLAQSLDVDNPLTVL